jgi:hypothetical protein
MKRLSNEEFLVQVPFPVDQVLWQMTNTANNRTRGQVVPYGDQRAYPDRLNAGYPTGLDPQPSLAWRRNPLSRDLR